MSARVLAALMLRLLPGDLREEYGSDFVALFEERLADEERNGGRGAASRYWLHALADVLRTAFRFNLYKVWPVPRREAHRGEPGAPGSGVPGVGPPDSRPPGPGYRQVFRCFDSLHQDLKYGWRQLRRNPGFTAVAVLTLAVGMGGNAAVFNLANVALLKPLPVENAEELVFVFKEKPDAPTPGRRFGGFVYDTYEEIDRRNRAFEELSVAGGGLAASIGASGDGRRVQPLWVSANHFSVLGIRPRLGRGLTPDDGAASAEAVVVISHELWRQRFGADPEILGTSILVNQYPFTVVGVAPAEYSGLWPQVRIDVWFLARWWPQVYRNQYGPDFDWSSALNLTIFGRLRDGVERGAAEADVLSIVASSEAIEWREGNRIHVSATAVDPGALAGWTRYALYAMATTLLVLFVAFVNTTGLMMARTLARDREIGIRVAIGCSPLRLLRQLLTEGFLLASLAGLISLATANGLARMVLTVAPVPGFTPEVDASVVGFVLATVIVTPLVLSMLPALRAWRMRRSSALGGRRIRRSSAWAHGLLVAVQVAVTVCLLVVAGLFVRTYRSVSGTELGFETDRVLTLNLNPATYGYDVARTGVLQRELIERIAALPGVAVATPGGSPHFSGWSLPAVAEGPARREGEVRITMVGPRWFEALDRSIDQAPHHRRHTNNAEEDQRR